MISKNAHKMKKLVLNADYKKVYTETVKSNGGNSAKVSCKKEFLGDKVIVFVLKGKSGGKKL